MDKKARNKPKPPTTEEKVTRLKVAMQQQLRKEPSSEKFEDLYKVAYMLVLHKHGLKLYDGFRDVVTEHVDKMRDDVEGASPAAFLSTTHQAYSDFTTSLVAIRDLLMYMDRVYVPQQSDKEHVERLGLMLFCDRVLHQGTVRQKLQSAIFDTIALERSGQAVERSKLKNICEMLMQLGLGSRYVYEDIFETPYLQQLSELEAQHHHGQITNPLQYAQQMKERLAQETERAANCFDNSTELRIHAIFGRYATNGPTS